MWIQTPRGKPTPPTMPSPSNHATCNACICSQSSLVHIRNRLTLTAAPCAAGGVMRMLQPGSANTKLAMYSWLPSNRFATKYFAFFLMSRTVSPRSYSAKSPEHAATYSPAGMDGMDRSIPLPPPPLLFLTHIASPASTIRTSQSPKRIHPAVLVGFGFGIRLRSSLMAITHLLLLHGLDLRLQHGDLPGLRTNLVAQAGYHQLCRHLNIIHCFCLLCVCG